MYMYIHYTYNHPYDCFPQGCPSMYMCISVALVNYNYN